MAELLKGKPVADAIGEDLAPRIATCTSAGVPPALAVVRVGAREADLSYERGATKRCETLGIDLKKFVLDGSCTQDELMDTIARVNEDDAIHGCLLFRPLPPHLDEEAACAALDPAKDVDGITAGSLAGVFANQRVGFPPCTADACLHILAHYGIPLDGANAVVVGRSLVIGKPVSMMLQAANATVTMCHTHTRNLPAVCAAADILVVAVGRARAIGADAVNAAQVVLDVGISWDEQAGALCGDVDFDAVEPHVAAITPVPGGVGSVTTAVLALHVVQAAERVLEHTPRAD